MEPAAAIPRFSIIVPAYNAQHTIEETLAGVDAQEYVDYEVVIVDDGSTDGTAAIVEKWASKRACARVLRRENGGSARAINTGIDAAKGRYLCINSSDDILYPDCLKKQANALDAQPDCHLFCSQVMHFHHSEGWEQLANLGKEWEHSHKLTLDELLKRRFFGSGVTFSRIAALDLGGYAPGCYAEDFDFYLRAMLKGYGMWYTKDPLARQRVSTFQKSAQSQEIYNSIVLILQHAQTLSYISNEDRFEVQKSLQTLQGNNSEINFLHEQQMYQQKKALDELLAKISNHHLRSIVGGLIEFLKPLARPLRKILAQRKHS